MKLLYDVNNHLVGVVDAQNNVYDKNGNSLYFINLNEVYRFTGENVGRLENGKLVFIKNAVRIKMIPRIKPVKISAPGIAEITKESMIEKI